MENVHDPYGVSIRKGWCNCWTCTKKLHDCVHYFCNWVALSAVKWQAFDAIVSTRSTYAVVKITEFLGASVTLSKQHVPVEESNVHGNNNKLGYSIKVEDSPYALVDLAHASPSSDVPCSSTSLDGKIRSLLNPEELLRISTSAKLSDLFINVAQKMLSKQFPKPNKLISTLIQKRRICVSQ